MDNQKRTLADMVFFGKETDGKVFNVAIELKATGDTAKQGLFLHVRPMFVETLGDTVRRGRMTNRGAVDKIEAPLNMSQEQFDGFKVDRKQVENLVERFTGKYSLQKPDYDEYLNIFA